MADDDYTTDAPDDDWEPYTPPEPVAAPPAEAAAPPPQAAAPPPAEDDWEPYQPPAEHEGRAAAALRELAHDVGPAAAGAVGAAAAGGALGSVVPGAGTLAGLAVGAAGGLAGGYLGETVQDKAAKAIGIDDDAVRAANEKEFPWMTGGIRALSNLVGFGRGAATLAERGIAAGAGAGIGTAQELYNRGTSLFTPEGAMEAAPDILGGAAVGALFPRQREWLSSAEQAGAKFGARFNKPAEAPPPPPPPPATPDQGSLDLTGGQTRTPQQMNLDLQPPRTPVGERQGEMDLGTPAGEQGQLNLPVPEGTPGGSGLQGNAPDERYNQMLNALDTVDTTSYARRGLNQDDDIRTLVNSNDPNGVWHAVNVWEDRQPAILKYTPGQADVMLGRMQRLEDNIRQGTATIGDKLNYAQLRRQTGLDPLTTREQWDTVGDTHGPIGADDVRTLIDFSRGRTNLGLTSRTSFGMATGRQSPHGTPGPKAAGGVAEAQMPPPKPPAGTPGHGPQDYGKDTPPQQPGGGVNVGPVDPTLQAAFNLDQPAPVAAPAGPPPVGAEPPPKPPTPPDIPAPPKPAPPPAAEPPPPAAEPPPVAQAQGEIYQPLNGFRIQKDPEGTYTVLDKDGNEVSVHPNVGQALLARNKAAKAAPAQESPPAAASPVAEKPAIPTPPVAESPPAPEKPPPAAAPAAEKPPEAPPAAGKPSLDQVQAAFHAANTAARAAAQTALNVRGRYGREYANRNFVAGFMDAMSGAPRDKGASPSERAGYDAAIKMAGTPEGQQAKDLFAKAQALQKSMEAPVAAPPKPAPAAEKPPEAPPAAPPASSKELHERPAEPPTSEKVPKGTRDWKTAREYGDLVEAALGRPMKVVRADDGGFAAALDRDRYDAARQKVAAAAKAGKPMSTKEQFEAGAPKMIPKMVTKNNSLKEIPVKDESTLLKMLDKHGTAPGLISKLTAHVRGAVVREIGNMPVYTASEATFKAMGEHNSIAYYSPDHNHIVFNERFINDTREMPRTVLHEAIHGVTSHAIINNPGLAKTIRSIMDDFKAGMTKKGIDVEQHPDSHYAYKNEREFLAEAFSNPELQTMLGEHILDDKTVKTVGSYAGPSTVKSAWDGIVLAVRKVLGVPASKMSALEAAMRATEYSMARNPQSKASWMAKRMGTKPEDYTVPEDEARKVRAPSPKEPEMATADKQDLATGIIPSLRRWVGDVASSTVSGKMARNIIMGAEGEKEWMKQKAHARFTNQMHKLMNQTSPAEQRMLVNYIQGGDAFPNFKPTPEQMEIVGQLRAIHQDFENKMRSMPEFEKMQFWDNDKYLSGQFKNPEAAKDFYRTYSQQQSAGGGGSTKRKFYPTDEAAREAGLVPISTNPIERVLRYTDAMANYLSYRDQIAKGKEAGYIKYFSPETVAGAGTPDPYVRGKPPNGWAPLNNVRDAGGRQAYAPRNFAETFNNFHGAGLSGFIPRDLVDGIRRTSNAFTAFELGVPTYHAFTTVHERIGSGIATAISQAAKGDMADAGKTLATSLGRPYTGWAHGGRLQDVYAGKIEGTPQEQALVDAMKQANFKPIRANHTLDYDMSKAGSLYTSIARGSLKHEMIAEYKNIIGDKNWKEGMTFVPRMAGRMLQTLAQPLFEHYIPRMKTSAFADNVEAWMKANPDYKPEQLREAAIKIGKSIDNRMGEMAHDNMMMNRTLRDAASIGLRSFSFTAGGVFREIGGGTQSLIRGALKGENRLSLAHENYDPRAAYALATPIAIASMSMMYQFLKTGKPPDELKDLMYPKTGGKQPGVGKGRQVPEHVMLPGYHKDIAGYLHDPVGEAGNKVAALWTAIGDQLRGTQMTQVGRVPIVPPKASLTEAAAARAKAFASKGSPIFARTLAQTPTKGSAISYPEQALGFRPPGKWFSDTEGDRRAAEKRDERDWRGAESRINADRAARGLKPLPPRHF